jgi:hypothetical protein
MIPQMDRRIKRNQVLELEAEFADYCAIAQDMVSNAGSLVPDPIWLVPLKTESSGKEETASSLEFSLSAECYRTQFSSMTKLMFSWIGQTTDEFQSPVTLAKYKRFVEQSDPLGLWRANVTQRAAGVPFRQADLGSIMDLNLLYAFAGSQGRSMTRILEVGGGYGRLAEAAFNIFGHSLKYVIIDAVPASLYYAPRYLAQACPDARIASYYDKEFNGLDLDDVDIAIVPAWHFERLNQDSYDVCVNIESMQEMNQEHVDHYLRLFQSVASDDATIYLSNARDYHFRGSFSYPDNWQKLFSSNTPRSWKPDHPTEIFRKTMTDFSIQNMMFDSAYRYGLWLQRDAREFISRNGCKEVIAPWWRGLAQGQRWRLRRMLRQQATAQ